MPFKRQRIRDPLHNLIEFRANEFENALWDILETRPFQRLRRIKQLGFSDLVYPGATHSRFAHSVGVFHTARQLMGVVKDHLGESRYRDRMAETALAASLVHDVGHGPFSHAFEQVGKRLDLRLANHAVMSGAMIKEGEVAEALNVLGSGFADDVADVVTAERPSIYGAVVSSQFDADRLDYMQRDRLMSGSGLGGIDFQWLLANIQVDEVPFGIEEEELGKVETFVIGPKAIHAVEAYVLGLFQLYPTVYLHKTTRGAEKLLTELLCRIVELVREDSFRTTGLRANHPLVRFAKAPENAANVLALDDSVIWGALGQMADARDELVRNFSVRLRDRKLYKAIDVRESLLHRMGSDRINEVDRACAAAVLEIDDWRANHDDAMPRIMTDETQRPPYREFQQSKGPANQIMVKTAGGQLVDIGDRSEVLRGLRPFRLFRVYVREDDTEARSFIDGIIKGGTDNGSHS